MACRQLTRSTESVDIGMGAGPACMPISEIGYGIKFSSFKLLPTKNHINVRCLLSHRRGHEQIPRVY